MINGILLHVYLSWTLTFYGQFVYRNLWKCEIGRATVVVLLFWVDMHLDSIKFPEAGPFLHIWQNMRATLLKAVLRGSFLGEWWKFEPPFLLPFFCSNENNINLCKCVFCQGFGHFLNNIIRVVIFSCGCYATHVGNRMQSWAEGVGWRKSTFLANARLVSKYRPCPCKNMCKIYISHHYLNQTSVYIYTGIEVDMFRIVLAEYLHILSSYKYLDVLYTSIHEDVYNISSFSGFGHVKTPVLMYLERHLCLYGGMCMRI